MTPPSLVECRLHLPVDRPSLGGGLGAHGRSDVATVYDQHPPTATDVSGACHSYALPAKRALAFLGPRGEWPLLLPSRLPPGRRAGLPGTLHREACPSLQPLSPDCEAGNCGLDSYARPATLVRRIDTDLHPCF